ncbi:MAG: VCBS repeat-containing protein [Planctomycetes bacterium]|nr:VCBS repeat-containing protein [Planctomycetota bacterium]
MPQPSKTGIGFLHNGSNICKKGISFANGATKIQVSVASPGDNTKIAIYLDDLNGKPIKICKVPNTTSYIKVEKAEYDISVAPGTYDVYLKFIGPSGVGLLDIQDFQFSAAGSNSTESIQSNSVAACRLHTHLRDHHAGCLDRTAKPKVSHAQALEDAHQPTAWKPKYITNTKGAKHALTADFNNDGYLDIVYSKGSKYTGGNTVLFNDQTGSFTAEAKNFNGGKQADHLCVGDIDADGFIDIICSDANGSLKLFRNSESIDSRTFRMSGGPLAKRKTGVDLNKIRNIELCDMNQDNKPDLVIFVNEGKNIWLSNNGETNLNNWPQTKFGDTYTEHGYICDINGDGKNDVCETVNRGIKVYLHDDLNTNICNIKNFPQKINTFLATKNGFIVLDSKDTFHPFVYANGELQKDTDSTIGKLPGKKYIQQADFNNDGMPEYITHKNKAPYIMSDTGNGFIAQAAIYKNLRNPILDDFNNDGLIDCLFTNNGATPKYHERLCLFIRKNINKNTSNQSDTEKLTEEVGPIADTLIAITDFYKPGKSKEMSGEHISKVNDKIPAVPIFEGDFKGANSNHYIKKSRGEIFVQFNKNKATGIDASSGGIILTLCSKYDGQELTVTLYDEQGNPWVSPHVIKQDPQWQYACIDLQNVSPDFNSAAIKTVKITGSSSLEFYLSTVFIAKNGRPDVSIVPAMTPHPLPRFNSLKYLNTFISKNNNIIKQPKIHVLVDPFLHKNIDPKKNLKELSALTGTTFLKTYQKEFDRSGVNKAQKGTNVWILPYDTEKIDEYLDAIITRHQPNILIFIGLGMHAQDSGAAFKLDEHKKYWDNIINKCKGMKQEKRKILPVLITGPYTLEGTPAHFDSLCDTMLLRNKIGIPVIDIRGDYLQNTGFKTNYKIKYYNRLTTAYHNLLLRTTK